jgi:hypothetical protein
MIWIEMIDLIEIELNETRIDFIYLNVNRFSIEKQTKKRNVLY